MKMKMAGSRVQVAIMWIS